MEENKKAWKELFEKAKQTSKEIWEKFTAQSFAITLPDGTEITSDTDPVAVGSAITLNTPEGPAPIPDGEYPVMIDGAEHLMVCAGGFVTSLEPVAKEEETPNPEGEGEMNSDDKFSKAIAELESKFESRFAALEEALKISHKNALSAQKEAAEFKAKFEKVGELNAKTLELIEQIGNETTAPVTKQRRSVELADEKKKREERMSKFRKEQGLA